MFGTDNSIEPVRGTAAGAVTPDGRTATRMVLDKTSIREATPADLAAAARRARAAAVEPTSPVQAVAEARGGLFRRRAAEPTQPDAVSKQHGLYMTEKGSTRRYYADYRQKQEVMRANPARISTKLDDKQTVGAMLDLAQSRGWSTVRLRGTADFQREAWVQAQVRGMATEGYKPAATDQQEAVRRKAAAVRVEPVPVQAAAPKALTAATVPKEGVQVTNAVTAIAAREKIEAMPAKAAGAGQPKRAAAAAKRTTAAPARDKALAAAPVAAEASAAVVNGSAAAAAAEGKAVPIQRSKAVWGAVEASGQQARAADAATAKATAGERPKAAATA